MTSVSKGPRPSSGIVTVTEPGPYEITLWTTPRPTAVTHESHSLNTEVLWRGEIDVQRPQSTLTVK